MNWEMEQTPAKSAKMSSDTENDLKLRRPTAPLQPAGEKKNNINFTFTFPIRVHTHTSALILGDIYK